MHKFFKKSALVVALSAVTGSAFAFTDITTADYEVVFSGATASSTTVRNFMIDEICDSTQAIDVFRRDDGDADPDTFGNGWGALCVLDETSAFFGADALTAPCATAVGGSGCQVAFRKRDAGGSGWGVTPVVQYTDAAFQPDGVAVINVSYGAGQNCDPALDSAQVSANGTAYTRHTCGATNDNRFPDGGFSDIEVDKFFGINTPAGLPAYNAATTVPFTATAFGALVFNAPVNTIFRDALQAVQFADDSPCNPIPTNTNYDAVQAEQEQCMPSLSSTEIRSIFVGGLGTTQQLLVDDPANPGSAIALTAHPNVVALGHVLDTLLFGGNPLQICRRVPGSGTQAQAQVHWLNWPCDLSVALPQSEPGNAFNGPLVANNSGSSDVGRCLDDFSDASDNSGKNPGLVRRYAIGVQSTEKNVSLARNYRFIKVNGFAPTLSQVHKGNYQNWVEQSYQYKTADADLLNATIAEQKVDTRTILAYIAANGNTIAGTVSKNADFVHSWGQAGWLVNPTAAVAADPVLDLLRPVNTATRAPFGFAPNSCQVPVSVSPVQVDM